MLKRLIKWLNSLDMCECQCPEYEVADKTLHCALCHKPVKWEAKYRDQTTEETLS